MKFFEIVFWGGYPTAHVQPLIYNLNKLIKTTYISTTEPDDKIINKYFKNIDINIIYIKSNDDLKLCLHQYSKCSVLNVFSDYIKNKKIKYAIKFLINKRIKFCFYSEVRDFSGILGLVRLFHSKIIEKKYVNNIELLFGIGEHSSSWFSRLGYDSKVIIKSCYYIDSTPLNKRIQQQGSKIRIIYLGRYVKSKGVINLLQSLIKFNKTIIDNIQIDFYGSGEEFNNMIKFKSSAISESINVYNELNYTETLSKISDYDYLILPSINYSDGWGVVVSEALSIGVPVIVSKFAGASTMVNDMNGFIYDPKNQISLLRILEFIINNSIKYDSNKIKCNFDDHYSSKAGAMKIHKLLTYK